MQISQVGLFALMLVAGVGIPVMAALNSGLGQKLGNPFAAVLVLCLVATLTVVVLLFATGLPSLETMVTPSPAQLTAGALFIFYIASITYAAPKIGLGNAVFFVLLGQLVCAAVIDHFALLGAEQSSLSAKRAMGLALMVAGVYLARSQVVAPAS